MGCSIPVLYALPAIKQLIETPSLRESLARAAQSQVYQKRTLATNATPYSQLPGDIAKKAC